MCHSFPKRALDCCTQSDVCIPHTKSRSARSPHEAYTHKSFSVTAKVFCDCERLKDLHSRGRLVVLGCHPWAFPSAVSEPGFHHGPFPSTKSMHVSMALPNATVLRQTYMKKSLHRSSRSTDYVQELFELECGSRLSFKWSRRALRPLLMNLTHKRAGALLFPHIPPG